MKDHSSQFRRKLAPMIETIIFRQAANHLLAEVVGAGGHAVSVALLESSTALFDVFLEPVVQIFVLAPFGDLCLIVQLDLIHQQPGKALRLAMDVGILGRQVGEWICRRSRSGCCRQTRWARREPQPPVARPQPARLERKQDEEWGPRLELGYGTGAGAAGATCFGACAAKGSDGAGTGAGACCTGGALSAFSRPRPHFLLFVPACAAKPLPAMRWSLEPKAPGQRRPSFRPRPRPHPHRPVPPLFPSAPGAAPTTDRRLSPPNREMNSGSISLVVPLNGNRDRNACSGAPMLTFRAKSLIVSSPFSVNPRPCHPVAAPALTTNSAPRPL